MALRAIALIALAFALSVSACSTSQTQPTAAPVGVLTGVVTGPSGPIGGAFIAVTVPDGSQRTTASTADGYFEIDRIPAGTINVSVSAAGFATWQTVAVILPNATLAQDVRLSPH